ncbi:MAG: hypothetical protein BGO95_05625 [Micrococcales bacterium 73-13]|nr:MAG: hypothetical protein BGO95_05625 [Micrococcales bacterium 73-13]
MDFEMQALTLAAAIQQAGSITGAAKHLGYSQPAVSQQLRKVEDRLGVPIVTRVGRSVRLTEAGIVLADRARVVNAEIESTFSAIADIVGGITGRVRIAAFESASSSVVPAILARMRDRHPGISVSIVKDDPSGAASKLADGELDIAITYSYEGDADDPHAALMRGLAVRRLFTEPVYIVLPADHPLAGGEQVPLAALADADWIGGCMQTRGHLLSVCREAGFQPRIVRETDSAVTVLGLVRAGLGVGMLASISVAAVGLPSGVRMLPSAPGGTRTVNVVTTDGARRVAAIAATLQAIDDVAAELGLAA